MMLKGRWEDGEVIVHLPVYKLARLGPTRILYHGVFKRLPCGRKHLTYRVLLFKAQ